MAAPYLDRERALRILLDAVDMGDRTACEFHKISSRTLRRYRQALASDPELAAAVQRKKTSLDQSWELERREFLREGFAKIRELIKVAGIEHLREVVGALKVAGELQITSDMLRDEPESGLQGSEPEEAPGDEEGGAGGQGEAPAVQ